MLCSTNDDYPLLPTAFQELLAAKGHGCSFVKERLADDKSAEYEAERNSVVTFCCLFLVLIRCCSAKIPWRFLMNITRFFLLIFTLAACNKND